jgi:hypothetical protein
VNPYRTPAKPRVVAIRWRVEGEPFPAGIENMLPGRHGPHWGVLGRFRWRWLAKLYMRIYVARFPYGASQLYMEKRLGTTAEDGEPLPTFFGKIRAVLSR